MQFHFRFGIYPTTHSAANEKPNQINTIHRRSRALLSLSLPLHTDHGACDRFVRFLFAFETELVSALTAHRTHTQIRHLTQANGRRRALAACINTEKRRGGTMIAVSQRGAVHHRMFRFSSTNERISTASYFAYHSGLRGKSERVPSRSSKQRMQRCKLSAYVSRRLTVASGTIAPHLYCGQRVATAPTPFDVILSSKNSRQHTKQKRCPQPNSNVSKQQMNSR